MNQAKTIEWLKATATHETRGWRVHSEERLGERVMLVFRREGGSGVFSNYQDQVIVCIGERGGLRSASYSASEFGNNRRGDLRSWREVLVELDMSRQR
jgi:hypothetical protein